MTDRPRQWWVLAALVVVAMGASKGVYWWTQERAAKVVTQQAKVGDITMYSTTTCPYCAVARSWLNSHHVPWRECNVDLDQACLQIFNAQGAPGTPLMWAKGHWHLGFDAPWLAEAIQAPPAVSAPQPSPP
jgi:glutaredoxin